MRHKDVTQVVVNGESQDETAQVVQGIAADRENVRLVNHLTNRGYAQAQQAGSQIALGEAFDIVALLRSDGQYASETLVVKQPRNEIGINNNTLDESRSRPDVIAEATGKIIHRRHVLPAPKQLVNDA